MRVARIGWWTAARAFGTTDQTVSESLELLTGTDLK
jgi:hypothetical protein